MFGELKDRSAHNRIRTHLQIQLGKWQSNLVHFKGCESQPGNYAKDEMIKYCRDWIIQYEAELSWLEQIKSH
jgi:hypothetical protein